MKKIIKAGQRFSRRRFDSLDEARKELADQPYKLELIELKGGVDSDSEVMEIGLVRELTSYDNLHAHTARWSGRPLPGSAPATTRYIPAFKLTRSAAAYWRGVRRTRSCSASTAPRGRARRRSISTWNGSRRPSGATTASWAPSWTCFPSGRDRLRAGGVPPRAASSAASWRTTPASARGSRLRVRQHLRTSQGPPVRDLRAPGLVRRRHVPPMHLDEEYNADGSVRRQGRTTTSSR